MHGTRFSMLGTLGWVLCASVAHATTESALFTLKCDISRKVEMNYFGAQPTEIKETQGTLLVTVDLKRNAYFVLSDDVFGWSGVRSLDGVTAGTIYFERGSDMAGVDRLTGRFSHVGGRFWWLLF